MSSWYFEKVRENPEHREIMAACSAGDVFDHLFLTRACEIAKRRGLIAAWGIEREYGAGALFYHVDGRKYLDVYEARAHVCAILRTFSAAREYSRFEKCSPAVGGQGADIKTRGAVAHLRAHE